MLRFISGAFITARGFCRHVHLLDLRCLAIVQPSACLEAAFPPQALGESR